MASDHQPPFSQDILVRMFCVCPGRAVPITEPIEYYTGRILELYAWCVGQWSTAHQAYMKSSVHWHSMKRFTACFNDRCRTSSTMVVLSLFFPLPGRTPSCPVRSNFSIISPRACSHIGPSHCCILIVTAVQFYNQCSLRQRRHSVMLVRLWHKKLLPFIVNDICICYCDVLPHIAI